MARVREVNRAAWNLHLENVELRRQLTAAQKQVEAAGVELTRIKRRLRAEQAKAERWKQRAYARESAKVEFWKRRALEKVRR